MDESERLKFVSLSVNLVRCVSGGSCADNSSSIASCNLESGQILAEGGTPYSSLSVRFLDSDS